MPHAMLLDTAAPFDGEGPAMRPIPGFRLRTLVGMRWFATGGQILVILFVAFGLGYALPLLPLVVMVALGVWANIYVEFPDPSFARCRDGEEFAARSFGS